MAAGLSQCPSRGVLEGLLAERLGGSERDSVETHIESCTPCQEELAHLCTTTFRLPVSSADVQAEPTPEPDEDFLRRLREAPPLVSKCHSGAPPPAAVIPTSDLPWLKHGRLGRYEILGRLAEGGMGAVFKARHAELGKLVALKVLPADQMDEARIARFKNEIRAIGRLNHPHIVAAHDAGECEGVHFLVMDFVEGMDLARILERHGRLSVPDACEAIRQAALGLQHALERGLVHRDIKPSNLMLASGGVVQVVDLGLARSFGDMAADTLTAKGMMLGTADYLAPEQWEHAHAVDGRADIYSLGCTLYHLIAGRPPFAGERYQSLLQKMRAHVEKQPPPIAQLRADVPAGLVTILERMLAKDPADRFQSPAEVVEALRPFTAGADLACLLASDAATGIPAAQVATPAPGLWDTASGHDSRLPRRPVKPVRYRRPIALAGCFLILAAAILFWPGFRGSSGPAAGPPEVTELHVSHFRGKGATFLGDLWTSPEAVHLNDDVRISAKLNVPAYYYLIAFNPDGTEQLCYPADTEEHGAQAVRPDKRADIHYPEDRHIFVLDSAGLQAFVLVASTKPLPPFKEWRSGVDTIPWKKVPEGGAWRWHFDGRQFTRYPQERGRIEQRETAPQQLRALGDFFKGRPEFEMVQLVAFPVVAGP